MYDLASIFEGKNQFVKLSCRDCGKNRVVLFKEEEQWFGHFSITLGCLYMVTDTISEENILEETDSIQIRPKAVYKNNEGYYIKVKGKQIQFGINDTKDIENFIMKNKSK